jgi:hypothetical protein
VPPPRGSDIHLATFSRDINDVVLLALSPKGITETVGCLSLFCDLQQLTVNLGKTKVMIFNGSKKSIDLHFFFKGKEIEITCTYTYLGVQFSRPRFILRPALQPLDHQGLRIFSPSERQCFRHHFQDISSKMSLMDSLI